MEPSTPPPSSPTTSKRSRWLLIGVLSLGLLILLIGIDWGIFHGWVQYFIYSIRSPSSEASPSPMLARHPEDSSPKSHSKILNRCILAQQKPSQWTFYILDWCNQNNKLQLSHTLSYPYPQIQYFRQSRIITGYDPQKQQFSTWELQKPQIQDMFYNHSYSFIPLAVQIQPSTHSYVWTGINPQNQEWILPYQENEPSIASKWEFPDYPEVKVPITWLLPDQWIWNWNGTSSFPMPIPPIPQNVLQKIKKHQEAGWRSFILFHDSEGLVLWQESAQKELKVLQNNLLVIGKWGEKVWYEYPYSSPFYYNMIIDWPWIVLWQDNPSLHEIQVFDYTRTHLYSFTSHDLPIGIKDSYLYLWRKEGGMNRISIHGKTPLEPAVNALINHPIDNIKFVVALWD